MVNLGLNLLITLMAFAAGPSAAAADDSGYVIEPSDVLAIEVHGIAADPIQGRYAVRPDGRVSIEGYGSVHVSGLSIAQARHAVSMFVAAEAVAGGKVIAFLQVDQCRSKVIYVLEENGDGTGRVHTFAWSEGDTAVGAVLRVEGLAAAAASKGVFVMRPVPETQEGRPVRLDVDWRAVTQQGLLATNRQLVAGDRVVVGGPREAFPEAMPD